MTILVTGAAGFIGSHTVAGFTDRGMQVVGVDNLDDYYDTELKKSRLALVADNALHTFVEADITSRTSVEKLFATHRPKIVINLAAQAGVRYSIENPRKYIDTNIIGFSNIIDECVRTDVKHLVFASSSSVYGSNTEMPFSVHQNVDHPLSLYAASKKANELMAHSYAHLHRLPCTGLRFFTVYGPWGRPDMAPYIFTKKIIEGEPIDVFNNGNHTRDFTYIDDVVEGIVGIARQFAEPDPEWDPKFPNPATSSAPYRIYNIGNNRPVQLMHFIDCIEKAAGRKAHINFKPLQPGDVRDTYADIDALNKATGFTPSTAIEDGVEKFVAWYKSYHQKN